MYTIKENVVTEIISYIAVAVLMICITLMVSASLKGVPVTDFIPDRPDYTVEVIKEDLFLIDNKSEIIMSPAPFCFEKEWNIIPVEELETDITVIEETITSETTPEEISEFIITPEIEYLAKCVLAEAGNQDDLGKRLVIDVVLNRANKYDMTITEIINMPGQFEVVENGTIHTQEPTNEIYDLICEEMNSITNTEVFFFRTDYYHDFAEPLFKHGDHYFSNDSLIY